MEDSLMIPVYIDTNALLDILASLEGGFSLVEKVTTTVSHRKGGNLDAHLEGGTEFGVPNVFNLFKVKLGASGGYGNDHSTERQSQVDRYHTYGSLLCRLKEILVSKDLVKIIESDLSNWDEVRVFDFVEVSGIFRPNPFVESLGTLLKLLKVFYLVPNFQTSQSNSTKRNKSEGTSLKDMDKIIKFLQGILDDHQGENVRRFIIDPNGDEKLSVVTTMFLEYLRDKTMTEISYKSFKLLGKVVQRIEQNSGTEIDLLTGTGLGGLDREKLLPLLEALSGIPGTQLPGLSFAIPGPAIEIVPVAIYA